MIHYIKYGNRLYLVGDTGLVWTHDISVAITFLTLDAAIKMLTELKQDTGLYEARIVAESDIAITVESVP